MTGGAVAVWLVGLDAGDDIAAAATALLTSAEREALDRFRGERARRRFAVCRATLRTLLAEHTGLAPAALALAGGPGGKPALREGPHFNVSHAGGRAAIAIGPRDVGIDLEPVSPRRPSARAIRHVLGPAERELEPHAADPDAPALRAALWTAKEAMVKALGAGLGYGMDRVVLAPGEDGLRLVALDGPEGGAGDWVLRRIDAGAGWSCTLATRAPLPQIAARSLSAAQLGSTLGVEGPAPPFSRWKSPPSRPSAPRACAARRPCSAWPRTSASSR